MRLRPLTVIAWMFAASPAAAADGAIRLFAPVPSGPTPVEKAQPADPIRLFSPAPSAAASRSTAPAIRGAVRETLPAEALPDRSWTVALP